MKYLAHCEQELIGPVSADKSSFGIYDSNFVDLLLSVAGGPVDGRR